MWRGFKSHLGVCAMGLLSEGTALADVIGRKVVEDDVATERPVAALWSVFDRPGVPPAAGEPIPSGWHTLYFWQIARPTDLRPDGTPQSYGVFPPMPDFPRVMFANTHIEFRQPIRVGDWLRREWTLLDLIFKDGRSGPLCFGKHMLRIVGPNGVVLEETRETVFRKAQKADPSASARDSERIPSGLPWRCEVRPTPLLLFCYSALTLNMHRIHYDHPFATGVEGFADVVIQGPLLLNLLIDFVCSQSPGLTLATFKMRAHAPLFAGKPFILTGRPTEHGSDVWAALPDGGIAMSGQATFN